MLFVPPPQLTFTHPAHERTMSFTTIASATDLSTSDVELLVMKALSLGLVRGTIDEVSGEVHMTWVQPRVLDLKQVRGEPCNYYCQIWYNVHIWLLWSRPLQVEVLHLKMEDWSKSVKSTVTSVQQQAEDLTSSQVTF